MTKRILLSWSTGKDCSWALHVLRSDPLYSDAAVVGLLSTINAQNGRVAMHGTRKEIVIAQSKALGIPLWLVELPSPCSNEEYAKRMLVLFNRAKSHGITHIAYGDLWLADVRKYRESTHEGTGIDPLFPIWLGGCDEKECLQRTRALAEQMISRGHEAYLVTVDSKQIPAEFSGRKFDQSLLEDLASIGADCCGERGEFHTVCFNGPAYTYNRGVRVGVGGLEVELVDGGEGRVERGQFVYTDLALSGQWGGEIEPCPGGVLLDTAAFDAEGESIGDSWMKNAQLGEALCPSSTSSSSKQEAQKTLQI